MLKYLLAVVATLAGAFLAFNIYAFMLHWFR